MKIALLIAFLFVRCATAAEDFPSAPFSFIGIAEKVNAGTFRTVHGEMKSILISIVQVTKGSYAQREIGFPFLPSEEPPLSIGRRYLFTAVWDRHGIRFTDWELLKDTRFSALSLPDRGMRAVAEQNVVE